MAAFSGARSAQISKAIQMLFDRCLFHFTRSVEFTHDELLRTFVKPEHRQIVTEILELASISHSANQFRIPVQNKDTNEAHMVVLTMNDVGDHKPFVVPKYATEPLSDADPEVMDKLAGWVTWRRRLSHDFSNIFSLLNWCNTHCANPAQVRYIWPGVLALIKLDDSPSAQDMVDNLRRYRVPATLPRIPPLLKEYATEAEARVTRALLLPRVEDTLVSARQVDITSEQINGGRAPWEKSGNGIRL